MFFLVLCCGVLLFNTSWLNDVPDTDLKILSHRGVHQTFHRVGLTNETCTANRIFPVTHSYLENTIPSIRAAFKYGADRVEIDVIRTRDNKFAVFHDWTLNCRTDGTGRTSDLTLAQLQSLDIGYGYTADDGQSFPFRGKAIGMMPSLTQVLETFPNNSFQINVKGNNARDAEELFAYFAALSTEQKKITLLFSGNRFANRWRELETQLIVGTKTNAKTCAIDYLTTGWFGRVPSSCQYTGLIVPQNLAPIVWGWPRKTVRRFNDRNMQVLLVGSLNGTSGAIDTLKQTKKIPRDFRGWLITNKIELIGPALKGAAPKLTSSQ